MDTRFIIYFIFICLKNFEFSWGASRTDKNIKINFVELGTITTISEMAGFCFIVSQSQLTDWNLWWDEAISLNRFACVCGFLITFALSVFLMFLRFLFKKQLKRGFIRLSVCVSVLCSPYLFFLADSQMIFNFAVAGLLLLLVPIFVSSIFTNGVYIVCQKIEQYQDMIIDFRLGEIIWALISRYIGLAAAFLVLIITPLKLERLFYVNTPESILLPATAFTLAVIINCVYLSAGVFKVNLPGKRKYMIYSMILSLLNAPYIFLYPVINNMLVNSGFIRGMYAPM